MKSPSADEMFKKGEDTASRWAAFEREIIPHLPDLFRLAAWLVHERMPAEDLVQETMIQALQSFHRFHQGTNARAWLITILYHMRGKQLRSAARLHLISDVDEQITETLQFEPPTPQQLTEDEVLRGLKRLPPQFQDVVVLSDVEDMTYKEIADALSVPIGTVMSRLHRGRKMLRMELAAYANANGFGCVGTVEKPGALCSD